MLLATHTTLNIESYMGAIMAVGVGTANAILLVTFAEERRRAGGFGSSPPESRARAPACARLS